MAGTGDEAGPRWPSVDGDPEVTSGDRDSSAEQETDDWSIPGNGSANPESGSEPSGEQWPTSSDAEPVSAERLPLPASGQRSPEIPWPEEREGVREAAQSGPDSHRSSGGRTGPGDSERSGSAEWPRSAPPEHLAERSAREPASPEQAPADVPNPAMSSWSDSPTSPGPTEAAEQIPESSPRSSVSSPDSPRASVSSPSAPGRGEPERPGRETSPESAVPPAGTQPSATQPLSVEPGTRQQTEGPGHHPQQRFAPWPGAGPHGRTGSLAHESPAEVPRGPLRRPEQPRASHTDAPPGRGVPAAGRDVWPVRIESDDRSTDAPPRSPEPRSAERGEESGAAAPPGHSSAPEPTGPTAPASAEDAPAAPRRRTTLIAAALVVVLVAVAGGVLAFPAVSNRLGLPWAPNAPHSDPPEPRAVSLALSSVDESAPEPTATAVGAMIDALAGAPGLGTLNGVVVDAKTSTVLWERGADQARVPASTTKILTSAAVLLALDDGTRIPTRVVAGGQPGTVVLVGGGDVTLSSLPPGEESIYPGAAHLDDLVEQVRDATGGDVQRVEVDLSLYQGPQTALGWEEQDTPSTYAVDIQPLMLDGGHGDPTNFKSMGVAQPARHLADEFASRLGAEVSGFSTATDGAEVLGEVESAPVEELVRQSLLSSDNVLAEALARQVAVAEGEEPSFVGAGRAVKNVLAREGVDVGGIELNDGSGISNQNQVPPEALMRILSSSARPDDGDDTTARLRPLLEGLPVAGGSGTLADRYDKGPATEGRGWVRAKTGTITEVFTLAGVVLTEDGSVLVFALMSAGGKEAPAEAALDRIAAGLRTCGCR